MIAAGPDDARPKAAFGVGELDECRDLEVAIPGRGEPVGHLRPSVSGLWRRRTLRRGWGWRRRQGWERRLQRRRFDRFELCTSRDRKRDDERQRDRGAG